MKVRTLSPILYGTTLLAILLSTLPAFGQDQARLKISGLEKLAAKAAEVVDVNLDGSMLKLASNFVNDDDGDKDNVEVKKMLQDLKGVYVKSFEFDKEGQYSDADVEAIRSQLRSPAWSRIVSVHSKKEGEITEVYLMGTESNVHGLAIIDAEPKELTVVNIVGPIDLNKLSRLSGHMGVPKINLGRGSTGQGDKGDDKKK